MVGHLQHLKQGMLGGVLDTAAGLTNFAVPAMQTATFAIGGALAAGANAATLGKVDALGHLQDSAFGKMRHAADNTEAGIATMRGKVTPHFTSSDIDVEEAGPWMRGIPDDKPVTELFIPGSHDTMSFGSGASFVQTQVLSLDKQLTAGVRAFDIRVKHDGDNLMICHGAFDLGFVFADVVKIFEEFLEQNPSEMLAVSLSCSGCPPCGEHSKDYHEALMETFGKPDIWGWPNPWPTLGEMRGRILLASRGRHYLGSAAPQAVQNNYKESDHKKFLQGMIEFAKQERTPGVLHCNWLNAVGLNDDDVMANVTSAFTLDWAKSPAACAYQINEGCLNHMGTFLPQIFYIDFPGAGLIKSIIARNGS